MGGAESEGPKVPRGLYMYGGVGTGKTMLMDLFAESAPPEFQASFCYVKGWNARPHSLAPQAGAACACCNDEIPIQSNCCSIRLNVKESR